MRDFLYERVYESKGVREEFAKAQRILEELWNHFHEHADEFREHALAQGDARGRRRSIAPSATSCAA